MHILKAYLLDLKKKIYSLFHIPLYTPKQKEIFDQVKIGDVVYCKMPLKETELLKIPEGHQSRPYLVADKKGERLICFPSSHKKWSMVSISKMLVIKKIAYTTYKNEEGIERKSYYDSYFNLTNLSFVPIENISHISLHLNEYHLKQLKTKLDMMKNQGDIVYNVVLPYQSEVEIGMVYEYEGQRYYIYSKDKDDLYGYLINRKENNIVIEYDKKRRYIHYENKIHIKDDHTFPVYWWFNENVQNEIHAKIEQEKRELEDAVHKVPNFQKKYPLGTIFYDPFQDEEIVYLFSYHKKDFGIFLESDLHNVYRIQNIKYYQKKEEIMPRSELADLLNHLDEDEYEEDDYHIIIKYLALSTSLQQ